MLKKWNFAVILSLKHKWIVKRLKFGSYFRINCGESGNDIFCSFWFLNSQDWRHIWSWRVYLIDPSNFWVSYRLPAGSIKREENVINIAKPCIHKAAGSRISEMLFPVIFSWKYVAGDMFMNQGLTNSVYSLPQANLFQFGIIVCQFILVCTKNSKAYAFMQAFSPLHIAFCQLSVLGFHCFLQHIT